jgi:hypothetical protein
MPTNFQTRDFESVRKAVFCLCEGRAIDSPLQGLFLLPENLEYIFREYVRLFEEETGWAIDPQTQELNAFAALIFDAYANGVCKFGMPNKNATRLEKALLINQWNQETINSMVFDAVKEARKKTNWLRRARDPMYGRRDINPIHAANAKVARIENGWRCNIKNMFPTQKLTGYEMSAPDD